MKTLNITILYDSIQDDEEEKNPIDDQIEGILKELGHNVRRLPADHNIRNLAAALDKDESDLIFNLCESFGGVSQFEQHVAALLEIFGKKFTGAGSLGLALAQDKALSKKIFQFHGIRYPRFSVMDAGQVDWADDLEFPLIVKPANEDASIGIDNKAVVENVKDLMERISYIHTEFRAPVLIEEFIDGRELYAAVLGNNPPEGLPILEWDFSKVPAGMPKIASEEAKWDEDSVYNNAPELFPQDLPEELVKHIQEVAVLAFRSLYLRDYGRVDMRLRNSKENGWEPYIIEVNPNPYLDRKSEYAMAARKSGLRYPDLIQKLLDLALARR